MADASHAVFLSYASQDSEAAQRICDALRVAGIEVFLDQSELRGGDAWDKKIRHEIHDCVLFIPIVSQHTQERLEGYFRHEWKLAIERAHHMAEQKAFLVPVVVDGTGDREALVPDEFREVQWTHLRAGETPPEFVSRIQKLLSGESGPVPTMARRASGTSRRSSRLVPAAMVVVLAAVAAYLLIEKPWTAKSMAFAPPPLSIAVLPLTNESGDASQQYFSDGLSEDLITALSQLPGLKVIGRTSSFQFRDSKDDGKTIGTKLGVAHLLEGSVRKAGEVVRVTAELVSTSDGSTQWSERYDRPYKDLFALQDDITHAVAGALKAHLVPSENASAQSDRPPSGSIEAYNAVLEGKFYYARETEADVRKAIERFTFATQLDPRYALAWCYVSRAWGYLGWQYLDLVAAREAYAKARAAAETAVALAPDLASSHIVRARVLYEADFDWHGAVAEYRRALEIAPGDSDAKAGLGYMLATLGQAEKSIELTREALASDPLIANNYLLLALYYSGLNRIEDAKRAIRRGIELRPTAQYYYAQLTAIEIQRGDAPAALAAAQREPPGFFQDSALAKALQISGNRAAADAALKNLIDKDAGTDPYEVAQVYAIRNDADKTFEWLDRAWSDRDSGVSELLYDPFILRYKRDPRFASFCRKAGLPTPGEAGT